MAPDRPVGSVSGSHDWAWNRWQAERRSGGSSPEPGAARPRSDRRSARPASGRSRRRADRRDARELESELERTEWRLQAVITRYERLLTEKNRQLDDATEGEPVTVDLRTRLSAAVRRLVLR
jgi:hypothetical protein